MSDRKTSDDSNGKLKKTGRSLDEKRLGKDTQQIIRPIDFSDGPRKREKFRSKGQASAPKRHPQYKVGTISTSMV